MTERRDVLKSIGTGLSVVTIGAGITTARDEGDGEAGLRVAHASPDAPDVDVLVDGDAVVEGLSFRSVTDYLEVPAGKYDIAVTVAGTDTTVFEAEDVELEAEDYTAVARGEVTDGADTDFTVDILEDTNGANIDDDEARIRAIHASPDAPAVDIFADKKDSDLAVTVFEDLEFFGSSGYAIVPAGKYTVEVRPAGESDAVFDADVEFEGGSTNTAFAVGYLDPEDEPTDGEASDEEFGLVAVKDKSAPPRGDGDDNGRGDGDDNGRGRGRD